MLGRVPLEGDNTGEEDYHRYQSVSRKKTTTLCQKQPLTKIFPVFFLDEGKKMG
ncbi:MAG: hypothetical protein V7K89_17940 [Nostoc sp.]|uniref:hypothetical protein n=1 Tax=Nostoc sp. TaxID=1180 RepID=UPI002FF8BBAE